MAHPTKEFSLERGVRQGDPLSPFLFILAAEGLNILTKAAIQKGLFKASGLRVNFQKSCVYGVGIDNTDLICLANHMGCKVGNFPFIYLGLPIGSRMKKLSDWRPVLDKFESRLSGWKRRSMSFGGTWHNIVLTCSTIEEAQTPFKTSFVKRIGDRKSTLFWHEDWMGAGKFCTMFPRLYKLENEVNLTVNDRLAAGHPSWNWIRDPTGRALDELKSIDKLLEPFTLDLNAKDK
ncbi:uncharacterized protein [Rutidosis leptorrhynchoides]|uniref:uncharacterized protein n=1 Tax=Rutidosis leptorrhynchoides TaxID=125765 RepID=UPI003A98D317